MSIETPRRISTSSAPGARPAPRARVSARVVGAYVPKLTRKAFEKYGFSAASLLTDWPSIVGAEMAGFIAPERLKWPRNVAIRQDAEEGAEGRPGAVLVLRVDPARALDVQYKAQQILERINVYFGYRAVAELRIVQAPLAKPANARVRQEMATPRNISPSEAPELADIADEHLRDALARLKSWLMAGTQTA
jgi:hypothetical protein